MMLLLKMTHLTCKTILVPVQTKMAGKGLTGKNTVKSSGKVDPAKKKIQRQMSQTRSLENDLLDLFPVKNDTGPMEINPANIFYWEPNRGHVLLSSSS